MDGAYIPGEQRFQRLLEYLEEGWEIDPPIFVRPLWRAIHKPEDAYHFILTRSRELHLLVVPRSPGVDQFVRDRRLPLNRL